MRSEVYNEDCLKGMKKYPDKFFDLAIVDPPYGIGRDGGETGKHWKWYAPKKWDSERPTEKYFNELVRVSRNQIIWGGNYFTQSLPASMGWIYWNKGQELTMSDGELAYTSFERALRAVKINRCKIPESGGRMHPTQKPVYLYRWLLENYAEKGNKILDTHMGSQSSRIAAFDMGFDYWGFEIDKEYFESGNKRFENFKKQTKLFQ